MPVCPLPHTCQTGLACSPARSLPLSQQVPWLLTAPCWHNHSSPSCLSHVPLTFCHLQSITSCFLQPPAKLLSVSPCLGPTEQNDHRAAGGWPLHTLQLLSHACPLLPAEEFSENHRGCWGRREAGLHILAPGAVNPNGDFKTDATCHRPY